MLSGPRATSLLEVSSELKRASGKQLERALQLAETRFKELIESGEITAYLNHCISAIGRGEAPPIEDGKPGEIVLHHVDGSFISIAAYSEMARNIHTHAIRGLMYVLSDSKFRVQRYKLPKGWNSEVFDQNAHLQIESTDEMERGDIIPIDGFEHACWFLYNSPTVMLKYLVELDCNQIWAFDPASLRPMDCESTNSRHTSLMLSAQLLKLLRSKSSIDGLKQLCFHPAHFVRWEAVRAIAYIDGPAGLEALERALGDAHPEVRVAAERTFQQLAR